MRRYSSRIDENQPEIVDTLRSAGASVESLAAVSGGVPDLLVCYKDTLYLMEVKNPEKPKRDQRLTPAQVVWHEKWCGTIHIIRTPFEALDVIK